MITDPQEVKLPPVVAQVLSKAQEQEQVVDADVPNKVGNIDKKRQQILIERIKRKINTGLTQEQALTEIRKEDYNKLPVEKKIRILEQFVAKIFKSISKDIEILMRNDNSIGQSFEINYNAIGKMFKEVGISEERQIEVNKECLEEFSAKEAAQKKTSMIQEPPNEKDQPNEVAYVEEGATVFGG